MDAMKWVAVLTGVLSACSAGCCCNQPGSWGNWGSGYATQQPYQQPYPQTQTYQQPYPGPTAPATGVVPVAPPPGAAAVPTTAQQR